MRRTRWFTVLLLLGVPLTACNTLADLSLGEDSAGGDSSDRDGLLDLAVDTGLLDQSELTPDMGELSDMAETRDALDQDMSIAQRGTTAAAHVSIAGIRTSETHRLILSVPSSMPTGRRTDDPDAPNYILTLGPIQP